MVGQSVYKGRSVINITIRSQGASSQCKEMGADRVHESTNGLNVRHVGIKFLVLLVCTVYEVYAVKGQSGVLRFIYGLVVLSFLVPLKIVY